MNYAASLGFEISHAEIVLFHTVGVAVVIAGGDMVFTADVSALRKDAHRSIGENAKAELLSIVT
jgi:hypothetical protein